MVNFVGAKVPIPKAVVGATDSQIESFLACAQGFLSLLASGDVLDHGDQTAHPPVGFTQTSSQNVSVNHTAVFVHELLFNFIIVHLSGSHSIKHSGISGQVARTS